MPSTYKLVIRNKAAKFQRFLLFSEAPKAASRTSKAQAFTNVWAEAPGVPGPHGKTNFTIKLQEWAICGTAPHRLNEKVIVDTSDAADVAINAGNTSGSKVFMTVTEGGAGFDPLQADITESKGAFTIKTDTYDGGANRESYLLDQIFLHPRSDVQLAVSAISRIVNFQRLITRYSFKAYLFCGLGRQNPKSDEEDIVPVAVWDADPNEHYDVIPREIFYVATGDFRLGEIVNIRSLGKIAKIDFSSGKGLGMNIATIDFTKTHEYKGPIFSKTVDDDGDVEEESWTTLNRFQRRIIICNSALSLRRLLTTKVASTYHFSRFLASSIYHCQFPEIVCLTQWSGPELYRSVDEVTYTYIRTWVFASLCLSHWVPNCYLIATGLELQFYREKIVKLFACRLSSVIMIANYQSLLLISNLILLDNDQ